MNKRVIEKFINLKMNLKNVIDDEPRDNICYSCYIMHVNGENSADAEHQWGHGIVEPSFLSVNMCNECFKIELDELDYLHETRLCISCSQCGTDIERKNNLFSKIPGICNHCFLEVVNPNHTCIRCDPTFPVRQEENHD